MSKSSTLHPACAHGAPQRADMSAKTRWTIAAVAVAGLVAGLVVVAGREVGLHPHLAAAEGGEVERRRLARAVPEDDHGAA